MRHQRSDRNERHERRSAQGRPQGRSGGRMQGRQVREDESSNRWQDRDEDRDFQNQGYRYDDYDMTSRRGGDYDYGSREYQGLAASSQTSRDQNQGYSSSYGSRDLDFGSSQNPGGGRGRSESTGRYFGRGPKGYKRSDERIKEDISEVLTRDSVVDAQDIEIEVKEGEVTLTGFVPERRMKHQAEDLVEKCMGVKDVTNNLRVRKEEGRGLSRESASEFDDRSEKRGASGKKSGSSTSSTNQSH